MSIFSIGVSGLHTAQVALKTTSNNISNVYTPGYNRELTMLNEQRVGGGVEVSEVQRQFDQFIASQLNSATSSFSSLQSYQTQISQIDNLLGDMDAGLSPIMQNFFSALQDLSAAPSDPAARTGVIGTADTLTAQFRSFDRYLQDMQDNLDMQVKSEVIQINNTVEQIATLNNEIILARAKSGEAPNSLLNQRDHLVNELSQRIDTRLHVQDGTYNITVGNGQPLVAGTQAYSLSAMASADDPSRTVVGYVDSAGNEQQLKEGAFSGGNLGGLMSFRTETLDVVQNKVGHLALSLAAGFNEQHQAGVDLEGDPGGEFFSMPQPTVFSNVNNSGSAVLSAEFSDASAVSGADYRLRVVNETTGEFQVTRRDSGDSFTVMMDPGTGEMNFDGMDLSIDNFAALENGDRFNLQPVRRAAGAMENLIKEGALIAAGQDDGSGDTGSGDNRNALAMQDLQNTALVGGSASLSQAYAGIVGEVGNRSNIVQVNLAAQQSLKEQIHTVQQSESGVNLDEEAANLIRFQHYYQANAKVIEVGAAVLDTLLGLRA